MWQSANDRDNVAPAAPDGPPPPPEPAVVGNPENRRVQMFCRAARALGLGPVRVIAYDDLLHGGASLRDFVGARTLVRIESPGENPRVEQTLVARGAEQLPPNCVPADYHPDEPWEHGRIYHPGLWYRGFSGLLDAWQRELEPLGVGWMNHPSDVRLVFDKAACHERLHREGLPVPRALGTVAGYDDLRARMRDAGQSRVFVKLSHGSSASGVVAFCAHAGRVSAITSVEMVESGGRLRLYNSLRLRHYTGPREAARLVDAIAALGVHVEAWLPKAGWAGSTFDLRVLVIADQVRHLVMRTSKGPITNLHLGNRRGDLAGLLRAIPADRLEAAGATCRRVAAIFPRSLYLAIDLMFTPGFRRHAVLEVNAFGDLLPGVLHRGQDTYTAELAAAYGALASDRDEHP